ncbi:hypothetical protein RTG_00964 [Rhodotorula toruloides ATCC 204091]|uniref:Uncharacterized protein n=1 Tax=Rhodotorula toruloides TaxID=5286 RepID=A0A0K3CB81_RHOTO|nr:hypothetical protein RTG_00964 [Rhodotorula toruloides ATCC 204091]KAK4334439.1 hypothetical protein RTBOTA2_003168 [Rhodotorula toruloides]PRQ75199.1 hypothetical protein AAT19DRAFT_14221 [Rhodotorula toruloides]
MVGLGAASQSASRGRSRWVGRAGVLSHRPLLPEWVRFLALTVSLLGLQLVWSCEMSQASPFLLSLGVSKSMMSVVFLAGPLSGLIVQPLVGVLSDGCKSSLGRRRPFIIGGCVLTSLSVLMLGWSKEIAGVFAKDGTSLHNHLAIACAVVSVYVIDFSVNVVQAMDRSLLVDVVSPAQQPAANAWAGRMFGFGAVFGYWIGGVDLVWFTRGLLGDQQLKVLTIFTSFFLCGTHAITCSCVQERILISRDDEHEASGGGPMRALEDIWQTIKTLPRPIRQVFNVQFTGWIGWFPILFFSTTWVAEIYVKSHATSGATDLASASEEMRAAATRAGTHAMLWHSVVSLATSILLPPLVATASSSSATPQNDRSRSPYGGRSSSSPLDVIKRALPSVPFTWLSLPLLWAISNGFFAFLLFGGTWMVSSVGGASFIIAAAGFSWAVTNWAPFALLGELILRIGSSPHPLSTLSPNNSTIMLQPNPSSTHFRLSSGSDGEDDASTGLNDKHALAHSPKRNRAHPPRDLDITPTPPARFSRFGEQVGRDDEFPTTPTTARSFYFDAASAGEESDSERMRLDDETMSRSTSDNSFRSTNSGPQLGSPSTTGSRTPTLSASPSFTSDRLNESQGSTRRNSFESAKSGSTIAFPPNHGSVGVNLFDADEEGGGFPRGKGGRLSQEFYSADPYAYGGRSALASPYGRGGKGSESTIHLPRRGSVQKGTYGGAPGVDSDGEADGHDSSRVLQIRHSDSFDLDEAERDSFDFADGPGGRGHLEVGGQRSNSVSPALGRNGGSPTPRIVVEGEEGQEDEWQAEGAEDGSDAGNVAGGGDQTGVILGCHNIFLVLPQFLVTALSSIIFAILAPHHSVLPAHHTTIAPPNTNLTTAANPSSTIASIDDIDAVGTNEFASLAVRAVAAVGRAFVERRQEAGEDLPPGGQAGWDAIGLIFRIGGISAAFSTYICFQMWRDKVRAEKRARATSRGYRLGV